MNLKEKLLEIQKELLYFQKNTKGFNYKYVSGTELLSKIRPLMDSHKILLSQEVVDLRIDKLEYSKKNEKVVSNIANVLFKFTWIDCESEDKLECLFAGQGQDNGDKSFGMACTYAERYFILKFFHVPTDEDDPDNYEKNYNKVPAINKKEDKLKTEILEKARSLYKHFDEKQLNHYLEIKQSTEEMTQEIYKEELAYLEEIKKNIKLYETDNKEPNFYEPEKKENEELPKGVV